MKNRHTDKISKIKKFTFYTLSFLILLVLIFNSEDLKAGTFDHKLPPLEDESIGLSIGVNTHHIGSDKYDEGGKEYYYNENNKLVSLTYRWERKIINIATFKNSYYNRSYLASIGFNFFDSKYIDLEVEAGLVTGYTRQQIPLTMPLGFADGYVAPRIILKIINNKDYRLDVNTTMFGDAVVTAVTMSWKL